MTQLIQLKAFRELKNYSQTYVAERMNITQSYYSKLENGSAKLTSELIEKAVAALGIDTLHPLFMSKNGILESLEQQQVIFNELQKKVIVLEKKIQNFEEELSNIKKKLKANKKNNS